MDNVSSKRPRVGVIFGGRSGEHEVSLASAQSVIRAMNKERYEIIPIGIAPDGRWLTSGDPMKALQGAVEEPIPSLAPVTQGGSRELIPGTGRAGIPKLDVVFPVLHGPHGEDGTLQGLLEMANIPYVGSGVLGSALGMDKAVSRAIFRDAGLPTVRDLVILRKGWEDDPQGVVEMIVERIGCPCFVKPANLGSSVGISKAHGPQELPAALALAARYDRKMVIEEAIDAREIECSVLGNDEPIASALGEIVPKREFYDYQAKYGDEGTDLLIPADLPEDVARQIQELAVRAFLALDLAGLARVDFFLARGTDKIYINEVNTMPGFTSISMYPKLWEASGLAYPTLIDRLIQLALERHQDKQRNQTCRRIS